MINITAEDAKLFEQNGFTREQVGATVRHYREQGLSDEDIQAKMNERISQFKSAAPDIANQKGIDLTPSGLLDKSVNTVGSAILTPAVMLKDKETNPIEAYKKAYDIGEQSMASARKQSPVLSNIVKTGTDLLGYSALPVLRGGGLGNFAGNAVIQGGIPGALEALKRNENVIGGGGLGTGIAAGLGGLLKGAPLVSELLKKPASYIGKKAVEGLTDLKPETLQQVIKPNSKALDLTEDTAQNLLMDTTERLQNEYETLIDNAGAEIQKAAMNLPEERGVFTSSLKDSLDDIYNGTQVSNNPDLNPAMQGDKDIYNKVMGWINSAQDTNKLTAPEMSDLMTNIKRNIPIDWEKSGADARNALKQQIYGDFARRLGNLSPELRNANKVFSDLAQFENNEGIRNILMPKRKGDIDSASKTLRNYNSTVTKGNTNRNIQDLEKILVANGKEPFLNDINDVNAAMDLLTQPKTGRNFLGAQTLAKGLVVPALKVVREANRLGLPQKYNALKNMIPEESVRRLLNPLAVMSAGPMLYGQISND